MIKCILSIYVFLWHFVCDIFFFHVDSFLLKRWTFSQSAIFFITYRLGLLDIFALLMG